MESNLALIDFAHYLEKAYGPCFADVRDAGGRRWIKTRIDFRDVDRAAIKNFAKAYNRKNKTGISVAFPNPYRIRVGVLRSRRKTSSPEARDRGSRPSPR